MDSEKTEMNKNPENIKESQGIKMKNAETYDIEIFNLIEEIEDIIDMVQGQSNAETCGEILSLESGQNAA